MIIYGASLSPFVRKVAAYANERGLAFEHRQVPPGADHAEFRAASPFGKVPGFADGDYRLSDSSAIIHYLEAKYPDNPLLPADAEARGRAVWYDEFGDTILVGAAGAIFFNRVAAKLLGAEPDLAAADRAEAETLPPVLAYIEEQLDGDYLIGDTLTLADLAVVSPLPNLDYAQAKIDWPAYPKLKAYKDRILGRESFAALLAADRAFMGG